MMRELQELHDEVMPGYHELLKKRSEIDSKAKKLINELGIAQKNYDLESVEELDRKLHSHKRVFDQINADIADYRERHGLRKLAEKIVGATLQAEARENVLVQGKFSDIRILERDIEAIKLELGEISTEKSSVGIKLVEKFYPILSDKDRNLLEHKGAGRINLYEL